MNRITTQNIFYDMKLQNIKEDIELCKKGLYCPLRVNHTIKVLKCFTSSMEDKIYQQIVLNRLNQYETELTT